MIEFIVRKLKNNLISPRDIFFETYNTLPAGDETTYLL